MLTVICIHYIWKLIGAKYARFFLALTRSIVCLHEARVLFNILRVFLVNGDAHARRFCNLIGRPRSALQLIVSIKKLIRIHITVIAQERRRTENEQTFQKITRYFL